MVSEASTLQAITYIFVKQFEEKVAPESDCAIMTTKPVLLNSKIQCYKDRPTQYQCLWICKQVKWLAVHPLGFQYHCSLLKTNKKNA